MKEFDELVEVMHQLRLNCPWDKEQTLESLRQYLLEETYECLEAMNDISTKGVDGLTEELGDVLLQVLFQAEILSETETNFSIKNILTTLKEKLIRRHPHIFANKLLKTAEDVKTQWDEIKKSEGKEKRNSQLDGLSKTFSPLLLSHKMGERAAKVKFEWPDADGAWRDFESEIEELKNAKTEEERESELGDIFFSLAQWARKSNFNAEVALAKANSRFKWRFQKMEELAQSESKDFATLSLEEKGKLWQRAKALEKNQ